MSKATSWATTTSPSATRSSVRARGRLGPGTLVHPYPRRSLPVAICGQAFTDARVAHRGRLREVLDRVRRGADAGAGADRSSSTPPARSQTSADVPRMRSRDGCRARGQVQRGRPGRHVRVRLGRNRAEERCSPRWGTSSGRSSRPRRKRLLSSAALADRENVLVGPAAGCPDRQVSHRSHCARRHDQRGRRAR